MNIIDNFISHDELTLIQDSLLNPNFPWYYNDTVDEKQDPWAFQFTHIFYKNNSFSSDWFPVIEPIVEAIKPRSLVRIKANLGTMTPFPVEGGWHNDVEFPCTTAIFYVNTNNGGTLMENKTKIDSVENRFIFFDSTTSHTNVSQTDQKVRCVINLNYF